MYGPAVYRRARCLLGTHEEASDVLQEVFVTGLTKGHSFRGDSAPLTWLYSITTHMCLNRLRNAKRRAELLERAGVEDWPRDAASPEVVRLLRECLEVLPDSLAEVAIYYYLDEMTQEEIAPLLGVSRRQVSRLLERLAAAMPRETDVSRARSAR